MERSRYFIIECKVTLVCRNPVIENHWQNDEILQRVYTPQTQITRRCKGCVLNWGDPQKHGPPFFLCVYVLGLELRHRFTPGKKSCVRAHQAVQPAGGVLLPCDCGCQPWKRKCPACGQPGC